MCPPPVADLANRLTTLWPGTLMSPSRLPPLAGLMLVLVAGCGPSVGGFSELVVAGRSMADEDCMHALYQHGPRGWEEIVCSDGANGGSWFGAVPKPAPGAPYIGWTREVDYFEQLYPADTWSPTSANFAATIEPPVKTNFCSGAWSVRRTRGKRSEPGHSGRPRGRQHCCDSSSVMSPRGAWCASWRRDRKSGTPPRPRWTSCAGRWRHAARAGGCLAGISPRATALRWCPRKPPPWSSPPRGRRRRRAHRARWQAVDTESAWSWLWTQSWSAPSGRMAPSGAQTKTGIDTLGHLGGWHRHLAGCLRPWPGSASLHRCGPILWDGHTWGIQKHNRTVPPRYGPLAGLP